MNQKRGAELPQNGHYPAAKAILNTIPIDTSTTTTAIITLMDAEDEEKEEVHKSGGNQRPTLSLSDADIISRGGGGTIQ